MPIDRRPLLKYAAAVPAAIMARGLAGAGDSQISAGKADYSLRIATGLVELSPQHIASTTLYNGQFPGPLIRFQGRPAGRGGHLYRHGHA